MVDISTGRVTSLTSSESPHTQLWVDLFTDAWCSVFLQAPALATSVFRDIVKMIIST